jgi:hypothetical protein
MEFKIWYAVVTSIVLMNLIVTIFLLRRDDLEPFQKGAQIFIVWLIPVIAGIGIWQFHRSQDRPLARNKIGSSLSNGEGYSSAGGGGD